MFRPLFWTVAAATSLFMHAETPCDQLTLKVTVKAPERARDSLHSDTYPTHNKPRPRSVLAAKAGQELQFHWEAVNTSASEVFEDVLVHFFLVQEEETGQIDVPDLGKDVLHEGALTMDFKPEEKAIGNFTLIIDEPGSYLLRVETRYLADVHGHDHYAAMDLVIE